jgi:isoquinoline 1-oxidoreductase beta subunit
LGSIQRVKEVLSAANQPTLLGAPLPLSGMRIATVAASPVGGGKLRGVDDRCARQIKGAPGVRIDNAVAVVADDMWAAKRELSALKPRWSHRHHS